MNSNIKLIKEYDLNISNLTKQIDQLKKDIEDQQSLILDAKKRLFVEEINGKTFKLRKTSRSKFYELEFNVTIDINTFSFKGTVTVLNPEIKKNWRWNLLDIAEETDCYIPTRFYQVKKVWGETYISLEETVDGCDFIISEMVEAYMDKKLVLVG